MRNLSSSRLTSVPLLNWGPYLSIVLAIVAALVMGLSAELVYADRDIEKTLAAEPDGLVRIKNARGDVKIVGWHKNLIEVEGSLDDLAKKLVFRVDGNKAVIEVKMPRRNVNWGDGSELEIRVPAGSRIDASGVSSEFEVYGILGGVRIKTVSGDAKVKNLSGRIIIGSVSGDISIDETSGDLRISTISGKVDVDEHIGDVFVESISGDMDMELAQVSALRAQSVSGEIDINIDSIVQAGLDIGTVSGDVNLDLPRDLNARIVLSVGMGGDINDSLTNGEVKKSMLGRKVLKVVLGAGEGEVVVRTLSGDVDLGGS